MSNIPDLEEQAQLWREHLESQQRFEEFREEMIAKYPTTHLVVMVTQPSGGDRYYGPFANGADMCSWIANQPQRVKFIVIPLRNRFRTRTYDDFYDPFVDNKPNEFGWEATQNG